MTLQSIEMSPSAAEKVQMFILFGKTQVQM